MKIVSLVILVLALALFTLSLLLLLHVLLPSDSSSSSVSSATMNRAAVRVLCFGDSLTAGFVDGGRNFAPYKDSLAKAFESSQVSKSALIVVSREERSRVLRTRRQFLHNGSIRKLFHFE